MLNGNGPTGLQSVTAGIDGMRSTGAKQHVPFQMLIHGEALYLTGDLNGALAVLEQSRDLIERTEQRAYEPEMRRWRGIVLEAIGRDADAAAVFDSAIAVADAQRSVIWCDRARENRASLSARS